MGVCTSLVALDPDRFTRACDLFESKPTLTIDTVFRWYSDFSTQPDEYLIEEIRYMQEERPDPAINEMLCNHLLSSLCTTNTWELDKLHNTRAFGVIAKGTPPFRPLVTFEGQNVKMPNWPSAMDGGLFLAWSAEATKSTLHGLAQFDTAESFERYKPKLPLLRRKKFLNEFMKSRSQLIENHWDTWLSILDSIEYTLRNKTHLGVFMV